MSFQLSDFFSYHRNTMTVSQNQNTSNNMQNTVNNSFPTGELQPGNTFSGQIINMEGKDIQILLDNQQVIGARLDSQLGVSLGQILSFEVKSSGEGQIALRPLYANLDNQSAVLKAIEEALIPKNEMSAQLVRALMQQGLPVDRNTLQGMYKALAGNQNLDPLTLVQMTKLGLPVTENNIEQFKNYQNLNHQLSQTIDTVAQDMALLSKDMAAAGENSQLLTLQKELLQIFLPSVSADGMQMAQNSTAAGTILVQEEDGTVIAGKQRQIPSHQLTDPMMQDKGQTADSPLLQTVLSPKESEQLAASLKQLGLPESITEAVAKGTVSAQEVLEHIHKLLEDGQLPKEQLNQLVNGKEYQSLLKTQIENRWLLKPEEVAQKEKVEQLYEKLGSQSDKITQLLTSMGKADSSLMNSASNIRGNVEFMNQLNQMFTYVQLPLKMAEHKGQGDLYVYTNKKNLAKKDGNVSALLHLDMEYLGTMDVFVSMQEQKVSTKFTLENEAALDFIEKHMHLLTAKLQKRGYDAKTEVMLQEAESKSVLETMMESRQGGITVSQHGFDMRA